MGRLKFEAQGVVPACLLPLNEDLSIDEASLRKHLRDIASVEGVTAITVNGHASEVSSCTFEEQRQIIEIAVDEVGGKLPIVSGVFAEGSQEAARIAKMAEKAGASALLVFPPGVFVGGINARPESAVEHYRWVAGASSLPLVVFQFRFAGGMGYSHQLLNRLVKDIPTIVGLKDVCDHPTFLERTIRELQHADRPVNVMTAHNSWLLASLSLGCTGILSGTGSTIADLQVGLFRAVQANDLEAARGWADRLYHTTNTFYAEPRLDQHNRMKEAQVLLGRLPRATVRPPLVKLPESEIERIAKGLQRAGLLPEEKQRLSAIA